MMRKTTLIALIVGAMLMLVLAACGGQKAEEATPTKAAVATQEVSNEAESKHQEEAVGTETDGDAHGVSAGAEETKNPIPATEASITRGMEVYNASCAVCHGDTGLGDGVAGASLKPPPANLHEDHVQILSDGAMAAIIHEGVEGTGMPAFQGVL
ncbi:MAG: c-type cytochrome, partial [Chloroflexi bacterium]|nr:c-type cytochrome [Chloroflexota bacterium]